MTQNVLAVFRSRPDDRFTVTGGKRPLEEIAHIAEEVAPLRCQQVNQIQPFGLAFEDCRRRGEKVHVRVRACPALRPKIDHAIDFQH